MDLKQFKSDASATLAPTAPIKTANNYGYPTEGGSGVNATVLGAHWFYQLMQEFENVIRGSYSIQTGAITPDASSLTQLRDSINRLITQGIANGAIGNSNIADGSVTKSKLGLKSYKFEYTAVNTTNASTYFYYYSNDLFIENINYSNYFFSNPIIIIPPNPNNPVVNINLSQHFYNYYNRNIAFIYDLAVTNATNLPEKASFTLIQYCIDII